MRYQLYLYVDVSSQVSTTLGNEAPVVSASNSSVADTHQTRRARTPTSGGPRPLRLRDTRLVTLIITAMNPDFAVQVSDRRLTSMSSAMRRTVDDEFGKALVWTGANGRFIAGFTGITSSAATRGTTAMLAEILQRVAEPCGFDSGRMLNAIPDELSKEVLRRFATQSREARRLTVSLTGFIDRPPGLRPMPTQVLYTNFQFWGSHDAPEAFDDFTLTPFTPVQDADWPTAIQRFGAWATTGQEECEEIRSLLAPGKPASAAVGKIVSMFPRLAQRAGGTVGGQLTSVVLPSDPNRGVESTYHSSISSPRQYMVSQVVTRPELGLAVLDPMIERVSDGPPVVVARPDSGRAPCPCGSGARYRNCHGRSHP